LTDGFLQLLYSFTSTLFLNFTYSEIYNNQRKKLATSRCNGI